MAEQIQIWNRPEAEARVQEVLDGARLGTLQRITDGDGVFEVTFTSLTKQRAGALLAKGFRDND